MRCQKRKTYTIGMAGRGFSCGVITRNRIELSERQATLLWQQLVGKDVISAEDETLGVIYPGRPSSSSGPDFRDAVIASQFGLTRGDVEVHVRSSDWYSHAHQSNAAYNSVVLHAVLWHDCDSPTLLQNGRQVPVLCLAQALQHQPYLFPSQLPCFQILNHVRRESIEQSLVSAGEQRFRQKAAHLQSQMLRAPLSELAAGQVLCRGMMRALGYARNTTPFENLAERIPLHLIETKAGLILKQASLLGTAGLLPSQRRQRIRARGKTPRELEQAWYSSAAGIEAMTESEWTFSHVYPNNSPVRRMVAASYLLERYRKSRLVPGILRLLREVPRSNGRPALEKGLTVAADGYWRNHLDFDVRSKTEIPTVLGNSKAGEITVNVLLPFAHSWGRLFNEPELARKAFGLYNSYPRLADNEVTRHMLRQLNLSELRLTACEQQGLIHIFRNYCREGRCGECPLLA